MSWQCELIPIVGTEVIRFDPPLDGGLCGKTFLKHADGHLIDHKDLPIGSLFLLPAGADMDEWPWYLADDESIADHHKEATPLFVVLPGHELFLVHGKCWEGARKYGGWQVSGIAPYITVSPSINIVGFYHGWIQNGVVSDDCDGRQFDAVGNRL